MIDLLFVGVGWTDHALTLNRIAVGAFFRRCAGEHLMSGAHILTFSKDERPATGDFGRHVDPEVWRRADDLSAL